MAKGIMYNLGGKKTYELVTDLQVPEPEPGHVVVHITLRPLNTVATLFAPLVSQKLGKPVVPGYEGFGLVHSVGQGVTKVKVGERVTPILIHYAGQGNGSWQEFVSVVEDDVWPVPDSVSDEAAAQIVLNPWTAYGLVDHLEIPKDQYPQQLILHMSHGEYLLQTAAGSMIGRYVIQLARQHFGIKTINVVRRREQVAELQTLGADEVICSSDEDVVARVRPITGNWGAYAAMDCVGGEVTKTVCACVRDEGMVFLFGSLGGTFDASAGMMDLCVRGVRLTGWGLLRFWEARRHVWTAQIGKLVEGKVLPIAGGPTLRLADVEEALRRAPTDKALLANF